MKFGLMFVNTGPFVQPEGLTLLAQTAEEVGVGWLEEGFKALKVPFDQRGAIADESIAGLRDLWSKGASEHAGQHYAWPSVESNPKPLDGKIPIIVGGHSKASARRAARLDDGFFRHAPTSSRTWASAASSSDRPARLQMLCARVSTSLETS